MPFIKKNTIPIFLAIVTFITLRLITHVYGPFSGYVDFQFYYEKSVQFSNGTFKQSADLLYAALFPTTVYYPLFLSFFMKIFGSSMLVGITINQILVAILAFFLYKFLLSLGAKWYIGLIVTLFACLNPIIACYTNSINAEIGFGVFILLAFLTISRYHSYPKTIKIVFCAVFLLIASFFRPLAIILFVIVLISLIINILQGKIRLASSSAVLHLSLFILIFFLPLGTLTMKTITGFSPSSSSYGWNLFVGMSDSGEWTAADAKIFAKKELNSTNPNDVMDYFKQEGIARLESKGILGLFALVPQKMHMFTRGDSIIMLSGLSHPELTNPINNVTCWLFYLTLLSCFVIILFSLLRKNCAPPFVLSLYLLISICAFMFLESHGRYSVSYFLIYPLLIYFSCQNIYAMVKSYNNKRCIDV